MEDFLNKLPLFIVVWVVGAFIIYLNYRFDKDQKK